MRRRSLVALTRRTFRPLPRAHNLSDGVQAAIAVFGVIASGTVLGLRIGPAEGIAGAAIVALCLMGQAAYGLQRELDDRLDADFSIEPNVENVEWHFRDSHGRIIVHQAVLWATVTNHGPTSQFTAQVWEVTGVPDEWGHPYELTEPTWDGKHSAQVEIPRGGRRRVKLASVARQPKAFWFWTSEQGQESPGRQWFLKDDDVPVIEFVVEVVNTGDSDQTVRKRGRIEIPTDPTYTGFGLDDC